MRQLLNVESGINDGLALPAVMLALGAAAPDAAPAWQLVLQLLGGVFLGTVVAVAAAWLEQRPFFGASEIQKPLLSIAVAMLILALSKATGANQYLAAFAGGVALGDIHPALRDSFSDSGQRIAELFKLAAVLRSPTQRGGILLRFAKPCCACPNMLKPRSERLNVIC